MLKRSQSAKTMSLKLKQDKMQNALVDALTAISVKLESSYTDMQSLLTTSTLAPEPYIEIIEAAMPSMDEFLKHGVNASALIARTSGKRKKAKKDADAEEAEEFADQFGT